jgi:hypothetical protein
VEIIGAALGDESDLGGGGNAFGGGIVGSGDANLLDRIQSDRENRTEGMRALVVDGDTVESDVALVAAGPVDGAAAGIDAGVDVGTIAGIDDPGLKAEKIGTLRLSRGSCLIFTEGVAERTVGGIDGFGLRRHFNLINKRGDLECDIQSIGNVDEEFDGGALEPLETVLFH